MKQPSVKKEVNILKLINCLKTSAGELISAQKPKWLQMSYIETGEKNLHLICKPFFSKFFTFNLIFLTLIFLYCLLNNCQIPGQSTKTLHIF